MKILIASPIDPAAESALRAEHDVIRAVGVSAAELKTLVVDTDAIIFRSGVTIDADLLSRARRLKLLVRAGCGLDNVDLDYARQRELEVVRIPGPGARAVAELAFTFMLMLQRQILSCDAYLLIMSRNAFNSRWVPDELVTAKSKDKPIFPLLLDDTELFLAIQAIQYEDVRGGKLPSEAFYRRLATVTTRPKKASQKVDSIRLIDQARQQKVEAAAEKASFYLSKITSNVKDAK